MLAFFAERLLCAIRVGASGAQYGPGRCVAPSATKLLLGQPEPCSFFWRSGSGQLHCLYRILTKTSSIPQRRLIRFVYWLAMNVRFGPIMMPWMRAHSGCTTCCQLR